MRILESMCRQLPEKDEQIKHLMHQRNVRGCSLGIIQNGKICFHSSMGVRNAAGLPMQDDTLFECASLTKVVFAAMALGLADEGCFSLDEPVAPLLGEPAWSALPDFARITPRHCLTHSSGLPNWAERPLPMLFSPGSRFSYSGEGFFLLQRMIEHRTGKPLDALLRERIFQPCDMHPAAVLWTPEVGAHFSEGFDKDGKVCKVRDRRRTTGNAPEPNAAWSLYATAESYAAFLTALMKTGAGMRETTVKEMFRPHMSAGHGVAWGLGIGLVQDNPELIWHWGDNSGFQSFFICDRENMDGMVILTNSSCGMTFCEDMIRLCTDLDESCLQNIHAFLLTAE